MKDRKIEPWRIVAFSLAVALIAYMWIEKDVAAVYATAPKDQLPALIATTVAVSLLKTAAIAVGILLLRWILTKLKKNK